MERIFVEQRIERLEERLNGLLSVGGRQIELEQRFHQIDQRLADLAGLSQRLAPLTNLLTWQQQTQPTLDRLSSLEAANPLGRLDRLAERLEDLANLPDQVTGRCAALEADRTVLASKFEELIGRVDGLVETIARVDEAVDDLQRSGGATHELEGLRDQQAMLGRRLEDALRDLRHGPPDAEWEDVRRRLGRLEGDHSSIEELEELRRRLERVESDASLDDRLGELQLRLDAIAESPTPLDDIAARLEILDRRVDAMGDVTPGVDSSEEVRELTDRLENQALDLATLRDQLEDERTLRADLQRALEDWREHLAHELAHPKGDPTATAGLQTTLAELAARVDRFEQDRKPERQELAHLAARVGVLEDDGRVEELRALTADLHDRLRGDGDLVTQRLQQCERSLGDMVGRQEFANVEARCGALERRLHGSANLRQRDDETHGDGLARWGVALGVCLAFAALLLALLPGESAQWPDVVRARRVLLVDESGAVLADLNADDTGARLALRGADPAQGLALLGMSPDGPRLSLMATPESERVGIGIDPVGSGLTLRDASGVARLRLVLDEEPALRFRSPQDEDQIYLGVANQVPELLVQQSAAAAKLHLAAGPAPALRIFDEKQKLRAGFGLPAEGPALNLFDDAEQRRVVLSCNGDGPALAFLETAGESRVTLGMNKHGAALLNLNDVTGSPRIVLHQREREADVRILDPDEPDRVLFFAPLAANGQSMLAD